MIAVFPLALVITQKLNQLPDMALWNEMMVFYASFVHIV